MENLNLLFYKTFYSKLGKADFEKDLEAKAERMVKSKFYSDNYAENKIATEKFLMKTSYPGLIVGTGYAHGVDKKEDIKVGFSFDYVTGAPYIPGSSVKGLLRSCFEHPEVIADLLGNKIPEGVDIKEFVRLLEIDIFGNSDTSSDKTDIFFDAVIKHGDDKGYVLGFDNITPHGEDLTKNPTPIQILKILPDVVLEFAFKLKPSFINGKEISAGLKKHLFISILEHFGIGAKTNVGYGILTKITDDKGYVYPKRSAAAEPQRSNQPAGQTQRAVETANRTGKLEVGKFYDCTVTGTRISDRDGQKKYIVFVSIDGLDATATINCTYASENLRNNLDFYYKKDSHIVAKIKKIWDNGNINMYYENV